MAIAAELGVELHPERIALIAEKLERINSAEHFALVKPLFGPAVDKGLVNKLDKAWQGKKEMTPRELAAALRGASAAAIENANRGTTELVWTGPSTGLIPIRHTEQVLCEVINHARRKLFIVSFVAYEIDTIIKTMRGAIGRNVQINVLMELSSEHGGKVSQDSIKMMRSLFPTITIYSWVQEQITGIPGAVHAKCAVADGELAFITSANLTAAAMDRNMELGVLINGGNIPLELHKHLETLVFMKFMKKV